MVTAATHGQSHLITIDIEAENHAIDEKNETAQHAGVPAAPPLPKKNTTQPQMTGRPTQEAMPIAAMIGNPDTRRKLVLISLNAELDSYRRVLEHNETHRGSSTFFRVPSRLREGNESDFTPRVVSIGPYHNENNKFKEMHDTKLKYLGALIKRSEKNTLDRYANAVNENLEWAVSMYSGTDNNQDFLKMIILDGCFIIEFLRTCYMNCDMSDLKMKQPLLRNDLLLVENQIPFFILEDLFQVTDLPELNKKREEDGDDPITIMELALVYFTGDVIVGKLMAQLLAKENKSFDSLLHLFHSSIAPEYHSDLRTRMSDNKKKQLRSTSPFHRMFWFLIVVFGYLKVAYKYLRSTFHVIYSSLRKICAMIIKIMGFARVAQDRRLWLYEIPNVRSLRDTGFHFRKKEARSRSFISDVTCTGKTIEIPSLSIQETTLIEFRNLVAFEQCYPAHGHCFTAYATFLNNLIDAKEDVAILREYDIIQNRLGEDGKVADFFNGLLSGIYIDKKHVPLFDRINEYYTKRYYQVTIYQWVRKFIPDFFTNPWAIPSMIAAFILLVLTVLQTFYTIYPYYHPQRE